MSDEHKRASQVAFEVWSTGELEKLDAFVSPHVLHHDPYDPHGAEGLVGMKRTIEATRGRYPDLRIAVDDQLAEGDRVATRWTATMTHDGKRITTTGITIDRFERGKIVEAWRSRDMLGLMRQTSAISARATDRA